MGLAPLAIFTLLVTKREREGERSQEVGSLLHSLFPEKYSLSLNSLGKYFNVHCTCILYTIALHVCCIMVHAVYSIALTVDDVLQKDEEDESCDVGDLGVQNQQELVHFIQLLRYNRYTHVHVTCTCIHHE